MKHNPHCINPAHMGILSVDGKIIQNPGHKGILSVDGKIIQNPLHGLTDAVKDIAEKSVLGVASVGTLFALYGAYCAYQNHVSPMLKGKKKNPRRRNGTKKGQVRKTARRAYRKNHTTSKQKRAQNRAKSAMALYHSGKADSLKDAWKMV